MVRSIKNLIAALLISISAYLSWTEILPAYSVTNYIKEQIVLKQELVVARSDIINRIENLRQESETRHNELNRLALVVPEKKSLPELITAIESIYSRSGLALPQIELGASSGGSGLIKIVFNGTAAGRYVQLLTLLDYLERNIRLFNVNSVSISLGTGETVGNDPELGVLIQGEFYWLQPTQGRQAQGQGAAGVVEE